MHPFRNVSSFLFDTDWPSVVCGGQCAGSGSVAGLRRSGGSAPTNYPNGLASPAFVGRTQNNNWPGDPGFNRPHTKQ